MYWFCLKAAKEFEFSNVFVLFWKKLKFMHALKNTGVGGVYVFESFDW